MKPIITFHDETDNPITAIDYGQLKAGEKSAVKTIKIFNNKAQQADIAYAQEVKLTTTDGSQDETDIVKKKWIYACQKGGTPTKIGGQDAKIDLTSTGATTGTIS